MFQNKTLPSKKCLWFLSSLTRPLQICMMRTRFQRIKVFLPMCAPPRSWAGHGGRRESLCMGGGGGEYRGWTSWISEKPLFPRERLIQVWFGMRRGYQGISWAGAGRACVLMLRVLVSQGFLVSLGFFNSASWMSASSSEIFRFWSVFPFEAVLELMVLSPVFSWQVSF